MHQLLHKILKSKIVQKYKTPLILLGFLFLSVFIIYINFIRNRQIYMGHDITFHFHRIESLYNSIQNGNFYPLVSLESVNGYGYALGIFYNNLFLYPAAIARLAGFSLSESYIILLVFINTMTFVISYYSFLSYSKSAFQSAAFSILYTLNTYRITDMVQRAALGELIALSFLPLIILGVYEIVNGDCAKWYLLTIGMSLTAFTHIISVLMYSMFILVYIIVNFKKVFNKEVIVSLAKATVLTAAVASVVFLPILEQTTNIVFAFKETKWTNAYKTAPSAFEYLNNSFTFTNLRTPGIIFFVLLANIIYRKKYKSQDFRVLLGLAFLSTNLFPWYLFRNTYLDTVQFPWRFLGLITAFILWIFLRDFESRKIILYLCGAAVFLCLAQEVAHLEMKNECWDYSRINNTDYFRVVSGGEYLPATLPYAETENTHVKNMDGSNAEKVSYFRRGSRIILQINDMEEKEKTYTLPLIFYKGYCASASDEVEIHKFQKSSRDLTNITVSGSGEIAITYRTTPIQQTSMIISGMSAVILAVISVAGKRRMCFIMKVSPHNN